MIKCRNCKYWSGQIGSHNEWTKQRKSPIKPKVLICTVNSPQPLLAALERVDGRLADSEHNCIDFENK